MNPHGVFKRGLTTAINRAVSEHADFQHEIRITLLSTTTVLSCKKKVPIVTVPRGFYYNSSAVPCEDCGEILEVRL